MRIGPKVGASDSRLGFCPRPTTARWVNRNTAGSHSGTKFRKWTLSRPPFGTLRASQPTFFVFGLLATGKSKSTPFHCTNNAHYQNLALLPLVKRARVRTHTADAI